MKRLRDLSRSDDPKLIFAARLLRRMELEQTPDSPEWRARVERAMASRRAAPTRRRALTELWPALAALALLLVTVTVAGATVARRIARHRALHGAATSGARTSSTPAPVVLNPPASPMVDTPAAALVPRPRTMDHAPGRDPTEHRRGGTFPTSTPPEGGSGDDANERWAARAAGGRAGGAAAGSSAQASAPSLWPLEGPAISPAPEGARPPAPTNPATPATPTAAPATVETGFAEVPSPAPAGAAPDRPPLVLRSTPREPAHPAPAEEATLVDGAYDALRNRGNPARAARLLDDYMERFPNGVLIEEALALSIEAASARDPARARSLARTYLRRFPDSQWAESVRRYLGAGGSR